MLDLERIQAEQKTWLDHNFPNREPDYQLMGVAEEVGELFKARLKRGEGIRGTADKWLIKEKDAVGDVIVFLLGHCNEMNWSLEEIIQETWADVKVRDWKKYPLTGLPST